LQSEMFRRYKENRDYEQAQNQYRTWSIGFSL
jgi:hypothetical protein